MLDRSQWMNSQDPSTDAQYKVLTIDLSPPSNTLADLVNCIGFRAIGVKRDADLLPAFRRLKPDLLVVGSRVPSEQVKSLTHLVGHEREGFPVLCISDSQKPPVQAGLCDGVTLSFLPKSFRPGELKRAIEKIVQESHVLDNHPLKELDDLIVGKSPEMVALKKRILQVAASDLTVLITGESGTGKEVVARAIHHLSSRQDNAFVKVNSAGLPAELFESELFGYKKGAFTGAYKSKPGKFELAHSGTILLDEIGEIPLSLQAKLLHALEDGGFSALGSTKTTKVDVRVLAATNADINRGVKERQFRLDLYYRLSVVSLHIPPLGARRGDVALLCDHFLRKHAHTGQGSESLRCLSDTVMEQFIHYDWPGNIRQLENAIRSFVALGNADGVMPRDARSIKKYTLKDVCKEAIRRAEKKAIEEVLFHTAWNRKEAATVLKTSYRNLLNKIKEYDIAQTVGCFPSPSCS